MGVGTTTLPYDAMRREASVTTNIATTNVGNQDHPLVLGNSLSPTIVDEEVCNVKPLESWIDYFELSDLTKYCLYRGLIANIESVEP